MFRFVSIFLVFGIAIAGYFFLSANSPLQTNIQSTKASNDDQLGLTQLAVADKANESEKNVEDQTDSIKLPEMTAQETIAAKAHVDSIIAAAEKPISIKTADHFVTAEQILQLPALKEPEIVKIESTDPIVAVIVSAPIKESSSLSDVKKNEINATAAQSFAVKIPAFKKSIITPNTSGTSNSKDSIKISDTSVVKIETLQASAPVTALTTANPQSTNLATQLEETPTKLKVLATVTGKKQKVATLDTQITLSDAEQDKKNQPILDTLKKNISDISDIKVEELSRLVTNGATIKTIKTSTTKNVEPQVIEMKPLVKNSSESNKAAIEINQTAATSTVQEPIIVTSNVAVISQTTTSQPTPNQSEKNRIKLRELLDDTESNKKRIFYLHAVNATDEQGIWGIIQKGLMGTFSKGINLPTANGTLKALIPLDADEQLISKESSFLGKVLNYKVLTTYVYNYEQGNIGKNPDYIKPGQQLIIVTFTEEELMNIYQHFVKQNES